MSAKQVETLLIGEDLLKEQVEKELSPFLDHFRLSYEISTNLVQAMEMLRDNEYQGILSQIYFPTREGEQPEVQTMHLCHHAHFARTPMVLCDYSQELDISPEDVTLSNEWGIPVVTKSEENTDQLMLVMGMYQLMRYILLNKELGKGDPESDRRGTTHQFRDYIKAGRIWVHHTVEYTLQWYENKIREKGIID